MKNKLSFFLIICMALLTACQNKSAGINILTDDLLLYDAADEFNRTSEIKAKVTYIECSETNIFTRYQSQEFSNIDLVIGSSNTNEAASYKLYRKNYRSKESLLTDSYLNRFYRRNFGYFVPYSADWNVLILNKSTDIDNTNDVVTFNGLKTLMNQKIAKNKIIFIPEDSVIDLQEYIFMLGGGLTVDGERTLFNCDTNRRILDAYLSFDKTYNESENSRKEVQKRYINIDKKYYLKKGITLFDIIPLSQAMLLPSDKYSFYFFDNVTVSAFREKKIAITKNNINMPLSLAFIDFITSYEQQCRMFHATTGQTLTKLPVHIPIVMSDNTEDIIDYDDFDFINRTLTDNIHTVLTHLTPADFINEQTKDKFLSAYKFAESVIANGQLDQNEMLTHITNSLNTK
ncbi:MAG: hypothetical protein IKQ61_04780 [Spirochaetales bacterium]|nr:hypothetical protein [Spirochaetales bacterium]MBR6199567.1 hypothetical protein [Spirochaetales bacterium]